MGFITFGRSTEKLEDGSLWENSPTEQVISFDIIRIRHCENVLPYVRAYHEKIQDQKCEVFLYIRRQYLHFLWCLFLLLHGCSLKRFL